MSLVSSISDLTARRKADGILQRDRFAIVDLDLHAGRDHQRIAVGSLTSRCCLSSPSIERTAQAPRTSTMPVLGLKPLDD